MKILKFLLVIFLLLIYAYSVWMTSLKPEKPIWGWICTIIFGISFILGILEFTKNYKKIEENEKSNESKSGKT